MSASEDDLSPVEDDLEVTEEPETVEPVNQTNEAEEANQNEGDEAESDNKKEVKVKRVRNPQPKLDVERLRGPRGLQMLENIFKNVKFKGHGHEEEDLNVLMKNYEYWCHRLFPKFPFDDCLERMERLGSKKLLQTYLKKIRLNMLDEEGSQQQNENEQMSRDTDDEDTESNNFDDLLQPHTQTQQQPAASKGLSEDQLERIRINRERAQRLRQQMLIKNKANNFNQSSSQNSQVNTEDVRVATLSQTSSICRASEDVNFTENVSVDSGSVSNQLIANLSEIKVIELKTVGQGEMSIASGTITNQASDDQIPASQSSVNNESFCFETVADVHATNASQESTVSLTHSGVSVEDAQNKSSTEYMSVEPNEGSKMASQNVADYTSEDPEAATEHQLAFEGFGMDDGCKSKNQKQSSIDDLIMEIDAP